MKVLFGQNVSPWLCHTLSDLFPDSVHVRQIGLREAEDAVIWDYAAQHGFALVTKDADFRQRSFVLGHPPKIVWLRLGNCSTKAIEALLRSRAGEIEEFLADEQKSFLGLSWGPVWGPGLGTVPKFHASPSPEPAGKAPAGAPGSSGTRIDVSPQPRREFVKAELSTRRGWPWPRSDSRLPPIRGDSMTGFLIDTNVLSEYNRPAGEPNVGVRRWLERTPRDLQYVSVIPLAEIRKGTGILDKGRRRDQLQRWLSTDLEKWFADGI